jgi:hypothetical protein
MLIDPSLSSYDKSGDTTRYLLTILVCLLTAGRYGRSPDSRYPALRTPGRFADPKEECICR